MTSDVRALAQGTIEELNEHIHTAVIGKAYIAVLKDRLANPTADKSARLVFDEAYHAGLKMAGQAGALGR